MSGVRLCFEGGRKTALVLLLCAAFGCSSQDESGDIPASPQVEADHIHESSVLVVKFDADVTEAGISKALDEAGAVRHGRVFPDNPDFRSSFKETGLDRWYRVEFAEDVPLTRAFNDLNSIQGALIVEKPRQVSSCSFNDPFFNTQWGLKNGANQGVDIDVEPVWEKYTTGKDNVIVAVLDGGVDITHVDLAPNCIKAKADGGSFNFIKNTSALTYDDHGTHVAGVIAAVSNNGKGIAGIAGGNAATGESGVQILSCQILGASYREKNADAASIASAIVYGATHGAVISQNSWGYSNDLDGDGKISTVEYHYAMSATIDNVLKDAVDYFIKYAGCTDNGEQRPDSPMKGGVVIFAAGNDAIPNSAPANYAPIIAVGSIASDGSRSSFSNYGDWVDICAPGTNISSTVVGGRYSSMNGTSMACPHVSGAAALLVSYFGGNGFTNKMLEDDLINGARKDVVPESAKIGPLLDVYGAFRYGMDNGRPPVITTSYKGDFSFRQTETVSIPFSVTDPCGSSVEVALETDGPGTLAKEGTDYMFRLYCPLASPGTYKAKIKAENAFKATAEFEFSYTVKGNHAPAAVKEIPNAIVKEESPFTIALEDCFRDEDGDLLSYTVESSDAGAVQASVSGSELSLSSSGSGVSEIVVSASDLTGAKAEIRFSALAVRKGTVADVYPNPVKDYLYVRPSCEESEVELTLMSAYSSETFRLTCGAFNPGSLNMKRLAPGRYSLKIKAGGKETKKTIIKL